MVFINKELNKNKEINKNAITIFLCTYLMCLPQEERDFLCLPGGSDTEGEHCDEGCGQRAAGDHHRKVCLCVKKHSEAFNLILTVTHESA